MPHFDLMSSITSGITPSPQNQFLYSCEPEFEKGYDRLQVEFGAFYQGSGSNK